MFKLVIPAMELYDEERNVIIETKEQVIMLEHSLVSLSKWESRWKKPFMKKGFIPTFEETVDYIRCMTITQNVPSSTYFLINQEHVAQVNDYIEDTMTATTFLKEDKPAGRKIVTAELIYYWMIALSIPFECQKWHLNKLLTLINVCRLESTPPKKMSNKELLNRNRALNASRRKQHNTKG